MLIAGAHPRIEFPACHRAASPAISRAQTGDDRAGAGGGVMAIAHPAAAIRRRESYPKLFGNEIDRAYVNAQSTKQPILIRQIY